MPPSYNRRSATKVVDGKVRRKNRSTPTGHRGYVIDREAPGRGYRHLVSKRDLQAFLDLIPDWPKWSHRLERIVLAKGGDADGFHDFYHREETGAIYLNAWDEQGWVTFSRPHFEAHRGIMETLGVTCDVREDAAWCYFSDSQARAFLLLHVFMHELGHHWDRMNQKHRDASRGEDYAERFANRHFEPLFPAYVQAFGHPAKG